MMFNKSISPCIIWIFLDLVVLLAWIKAAIKAFPFVHRPLKAAAFLIDKPCAKKTVGPHSSSYNYSSSTCVLVQTLYSLSLD